MVCVCIGVAESQRDRFKVLSIFCLASDGTYGKANVIDTLNSLLFSIDKFDYLFLLNYNRIRLPV